jgi:CelD/BcsL family acetyltransferase involved in cellulose biosynthesis
VAGSSLISGAVSTEPVAGGLTVEAVDTEAGFNALRGEWNLLASRLALPSPFQSWEWHRTWWRHLAMPGDRLNLVLFRRAGALVGLAPMKARTLFGVTEVSPLGWRDRLTEYSVLLFPEVDKADLLQELPRRASMVQQPRTCGPEPRR